MFEGYALLSHDLLEIFLKILLFIGRCMMNVNQGSHDIKKTAEETFGNLGQDKNNGGEDLYRHSLRQLSIVYHLLHYRVDRPLQEERYWPECLKLLREELDSALFAQKIPESWLKDFLPRRKSEEERTMIGLYESSLQSLLAAAREEIEKVLNKLREIESQAEKFWRPYQKRRYIKLELAALNHWALRRAWEVYKAIDFNVSRPVVGRPRQYAASRNNGFSKVAQCA
jgi:hypothetical protein